MSDGRVGLFPSGGDSPGSGGVSLVVKFGSIGLDGRREGVMKASWVRRRRIIVVVCFDLMPRLWLKLWWWI